MSSAHPLQRINLPTLRLERSGDRIWAVVQTKAAGEVRVEVDARQLERWVMRQLREALV